MQLLWHHCSFLYSQLLVLQDFGDQNNEEIPRRRSHGSFDSSLALPTVEEEAPSRPASNTHNISELGIDKTDSPVGKNKSQKLEDIVNAFHKVYPEEDGREATEMAVRCGKNRFINAGQYQLHMHSSRISYRPKMYMLPSGANAWKVCCAKID